MKKKCPVPDWTPEPDGAINNPNVVRLSLYQDSRRAPSNHCLE